jgi:tetratricopeptide (TPR) repeat protein
MLARQGKFSEAITAYRRALILNPDAVNALQGLAWILATSTNAELRNGAEAVRLAQHAAELTGRKQPLILTALDAALAENGRFDEAIKTAQETTRLARSLKQDAIADQAQARIELYQQGKPFHQ